MISPLMLLRSVWNRFGSWLEEGDAKTKEELAGLFEGRPVRSDEQFYECFFSNSGIPQHVVSKVRKIFQESIPADLSKLEAEDDFSGDFGLVWALDSMVDVEIVISLEKDFGIKITDREAADMKTFRVIVETVWSKIQLHG